MGRGSLTVSGNEMCSQSRSVEELKERYFSVCNRLVKARGGEEGDMIAFDAPHEVKRKMQVDFHFCSLFH